MEQLTFHIDEDYENERIDKYLSEYMKDQSRSYIQKLIESDAVFVNDKKVKSSYKLKFNDEIKVDLPEPIIPDIIPQDIPINILYEDDDIIVINKPKDMVVHPSAGHYDGTLVNAMLFHCKGQLSGINGTLRPGIVHRIDKNTTGSVIICKNDFSHRSIAEQLKEHSIKRRYLAIVHGTFTDSEGTISTLIGRDPNNRLKMAVVSNNGKTAVTHYKVLETFNNYSLVECALETGRTHQIRVHMAHINHPILGDDTYSNRTHNFKLNGQCLHAYILGFIQPHTKEYIETIAPVPEYFEHMLSVLRQS